MFSSILSVGGFAFSTVLAELFNDFERSLVNFVVILRGKKSLDIMFMIDFYFAKATSSSSSSSSSILKEGITL